MSWRSISSQTLLPSILAVAFLLPAGVCFAQTGQAGSPTAVVGEEAPRFFNHECDGGSFYLSDWCGPGNNVRNYRIRSGEMPKHIVVLSFFATWCGPCKHELPEFDRLRRAFGDIPAQWRAVAAGDDPESAMAMLEELGVTIPCLNDRYLVTTKKYAGDPPRLPTAVVIDQERVVRYVHAGYDPEQRLKELAGVVAALLDVPVPEEWCEASAGAADSSLTSESVAPTGQ